MFTPEDGTGLSNSNSYNSVTDLIDYLTLRGIVCCNTLELQQAHLVRATDFISREYQNRLAGELLNATQALLFPRVVDGVTIYPDALTKATNILAIRSTSSELREPTYKRVLKEELEGLKVTYDEHSKDEVTYNEIEQLMQPYLISDTTSDYYHPVCRV